MPEYAVPRQDYHGEPFADWLTAQLQKNPHYPLPQGWKNDHGRAVRDTHSFLDDAMMYGAPAVGFGIAGGAGIANAMGTTSAGAGSAAGIGSGEAGSTAVPGSSLWGSSGAAKLGSSLSGESARNGLSGLLKGLTGRDWLDLGGQVMPMVGSLLSKGGNPTPMDAELQNLLRMQNTRMQQADPLYQAILKMAMGLLPRGVQPPQSAPPMTAPQPGMTRPRY